MESKESNALRQVLRMGQAGVVTPRGGATATSILNNPITPAMNQFLLYHHDNEGFTVLTASHPHLLAKMEQYTLSWTLAGKYIVANTEVMKDYIRNMRELLQISQKPPITLPDNMTLPEFKTYMFEFLDYLEDTVLPVLPVPPARPEESNKEEPLPEDIRKIIDENQRTSE